VVCPSVASSWARGEAHATARHGATLEGESRRRMDLEEEDESRDGDWISRRRSDLEDNEVASAVASANAAPEAADERYGERPRPPSAEWWFLARKR
jgi:hypothetical protein